HGNLISQGMTDKTDRHLMLFVEPGLEREQGQHQIYCLGNLEDTVLPPGPHRGADVVHRGNTGTTQLQLHTNREVWRINADKNIGRRVQKVTHQTTADTHQLPQAPKNLHQPHDRQTFHGYMAVKALGQHQRPTNPLELRVRITSPQGLHQASAQNVSRHFANHDTNTKRPATGSWIYGLSDNAAL